LKQRPGIKNFLKRVILNHRTLILHEAQHMQDFMGLLMKRKNTGSQWTREEIIRLRSHLKRLALYVPSLIIFVLPFGSLLIPVLAKALDRREKNRMNEAGDKQP
jgi:hypothetical protein